MERQDYPAAIELLREAAARRDDDLEVHYRLGVSASYLERVDEASREFEWVVAHGEPRAAEVRVARDWLVSKAASNAPAPSIPLPANDPGAQRLELASLSGKAVGPDKPMIRLQLFLKGVPGTAVRDEYHLLRTDQQGTFRFPNVVPGEYMLTDGIAGTPRWRLRVVLARGQRSVLDLSPSNDASVRDDFPERSQ